MPKTHFSLKIREMGLNCPGTTNRQDELLNVHLDGLAMADIIPCCHILELKILINPHGQPYLYAQGY